MRRILNLFLLMAFAINVCAIDELQIKPHQTVAGLSDESDDAYIELYLVNESFDVANLQFDILLPEGMEYADYGEFTDRVPSTTKKGNKTYDFSYQTNVLEDGYIRFMFIPGGEMRKIEKGSGTILYINFKTNANMAAGIHPILMKNIKLVESTTSAITIDDVSSYVIIGNDNPLKTQTDIDMSSLIGGIPSFVVEAINADIASNAGLKYIDLTGADALGANFVMPNEQAKIVVKEGSPLASLPYAVTSKEPAVEGIAINETNFPDANFRSYLLSQSYGSDGVITDAEIAEISYIVVKEKSIASLKGIEFFTALIYLDCSSNQLTTLDLSNNKELGGLNCSNNLLTTLNVEGCTLLGLKDLYDFAILNCSGNQIKGAGMDAFVESLPENTNNCKLQIIGINNEGNVMTAAQVAAARAKGWKPLAFNEEEDNRWYSYLGSDVPVPEPVEINETNFPDPLFREYVSSKFDRNYDGKVSFYEGQRGDMEPDGRDIKSLKGIEFFTEIEGLYCHNDQLTTLDLSKNTLLKEVECQNNQIRGKGMDELIENLPKTRNAKLYVIGLPEPRYSGSGITIISDGNVMTSKQVAAAIAKGWTPYYRIQDTSGKKSWEPYEGNIATAIQPITDETTVTISGNSDVYETLDLSNTAVNNVLYTLDTASGDCYDNTDQSITIVSTMSDADIAEMETLIPGTPEFAEKFNGITLELAAGEGSVTFDCQTVGNRQLTVKIGNAPAATYTKSDRSEVKVAYNVAEPCFMYIYATATSASRGTEPTAVENALKLNGYIVKPGDTTITGIAINETNFPDANFRTFLLSQSYGSDGVITDAEIAEIQSMYLDEKNIASLKGIEYFTALTNLSCGNNQLTALDLSKNTALINLNCSNNLLTSLNVTGCAALGYTDSYLSAGSMSCNNNKLKGEEMDAFISSLPMSPSLKELYIIYDDENEGNVMTGAQVDAARAKGWIPMTFKIEEYKITAYAYLGADVPEPELVEINETNFPDEYFRNYVSSEFDSDHDGKLSYMETSYKGRLKIEVNSKNIQSLKGIEYISGMTELSCYKNQLTTIDISKNTLLTKLNVRNNQLTALDVSKNTLLVELRCDGNPLSSIDISKNTLLTVLDATNTQLTTIDLSKNLAMEKLYVAENQLTALDLSMNSALRILECEKNQLTAIDLSNKPKLESLYCDNNKLTALDFSEAPTLCSLRCYNNLIKGAAMDIFVNSLPQFHDEWGATEGSFDALTTKPTEGNVITTTHVAALKAKGWTPQIGIYEGTYEGKDYYTEWKEYEGSDPTGIEAVESISSNETTDDAQAIWYDLNGRRVTAPTKGIYVKNGKKVVVK